MSFHTIEEINNSKELQELYKKEYGVKWNGLISKGVKIKEEVEE